ncbi:hypothetical protein PHMEG_00031829 [Phytophthora megakarya]|uniref:Uncharacterized protein n=1 Tax=Phytophthora megakarya TaxID=4795 RepID=A0A225UXD8_9STRA|nr:hypothetical protein PHMEG_00031829 [Phytophthora megakarya]
MERTDCPHLADPEWETLQRLSTVIGEGTVATMLRTISPTEQHGVALGFIMREQHEVAAAKPVSPGETPRKEYLKLRVSNYIGREGETLLRWLAELDTAVMARRLVDPLAKVAFAITYESFKEELKREFQPPRNEFRSRAEFLDLQQAHDVHAYAQRARYLVSNVVTDPMDETTKVVTFMKGLRDGPVKTYLFREYASTLEAAITLAIQEDFSLRQAKLHTNVPRPPRPVAKTEGPGPMDLSYAPAVGQQKNKGSNVRCFRCGNIDHYALTRVYNGHAVLSTAAPSERESHGEVQDDMSNLVILKVKSMTKRVGPLRVLVNSGGASNNFDRQQSLPLLDFEEKHVPRSKLEVRLATGAIVKTEKCVIRKRFSYKHLVVLVLELDDHFDMVLGMPWLARHDPEIDWEKRTVVRFGRRGATESDDPVSAADTSNGASEPPSEIMARATVSGRSAWSARAVTTPGVVNRKEVSGQGPDTTKKFSAIRRRGDNSVPTPGVDTHSITKSRGYSAMRRRSDSSVSTPEANTRSISESRKFSAVRRRGDNGVSTLEVATHCSAYHNVPTAGHPGCEKTYSLLTKHFYWNPQYK